MDLSKKLKQIEEKHEFFKKKISVNNDIVSEEDLENLKSLIKDAQKTLEDETRRNKEKDVFQNQEIDFQVKRTEALFKTSWKWRIGSVFIEFIVLIQKFIKNPISFLKNPVRPLKEYCGHIFPNKEKIIKSLYRKPISKNNSEILNSSSQPNSSTAQNKKNIFLNPLPIVTKSINKIEIAGIFDDFTLRCFEPEFNINLLSNNDFKNELDLPDLSALFIESSWKGNNLQWRGEVGKYIYNDNNEKIKEVVKKANSKSIPTIFWNKEDPVHYDHFIATANLFDFIFTSDANSVSNYKKEGNTNVFALPFGAQPILHNPVVIRERKQKVCFAGTYWREKYFERQRQLGFLLKPSIKFGLEIYDRNFVNGSSPDHYAFPEIYNENLQGGVPYTEMINLYKEYKVFLNVNSVNESPTMFSRRVFEILASGTPIISPPNQGILNLLGDDIVLFSSSEKETEEHLNRLFTDEIYWKKLSLKGIRKVHSEHTYSHRANFILDKVGIENKQKNKSNFNLIVQINSEEELKNLIENLRRQECKINKLFYFSEVINIEKELDNINIDYIKSTSFSDFIKFSKKNCEDEYFLFWDVNSYYGPNYLLDFQHASVYNKSELFGKSSYYNLSNSRLRYVTYSKEYLLCNAVNFKTLMTKQNMITHDMLISFFEKKDTEFKITENKIVSLDSFNFIDSHNTKKINQNLFEQVTV